MNIEEDFKKFMKKIVEKATEELLEEDEGCGCESCRKGKCSEKSEGESICDELDSEYRAFFEWCFGKDTNQIASFENAQLCWSKKNPSLPMPRVMLIKGGIPATERMIMLMIDAYPMYLKEKSTQQVKEK